MPLPQALRELLHLLAQLDHAAVRLLRAGPLPQLPVLAAEAAELLLEAPDLAAVLLHLLLALCVPAQLLPQLRGLDLGPPLQRKGLGLLLLALGACALVLQRGGTVQQLPLQLALVLAAALELAGVLLGALSRQHQLALQIGNTPHAGWIGLGAGLGVVELGDELQLPAINLFALQARRLPELPVLLHEALVLLLVASKHALSHLQLLLQAHRVGGSVGGCRGAEAAALARGRQGDVLLQSLPLLAEAGELPPERREALRELVALCEGAGGVIRILRGAIGKVVLHRLKLLIQVLQQHVLLFDGSCACCRAVFQLAAVQTKAHDLPLKSHSLCLRARLGGRHLCVVVLEQRNLAQQRLQLHLQELQLPPLRARVAQGGGGGSAEAGPASGRSGEGVQLRPQLLRRQRAQARRQARACAQGAGPSVAAAEHGADEHGGGVHGAAEGHGVRHAKVPRPPIRLPLLFFGGVGGPEDQQLSICALEPLTLIGTTSLPSVRSNRIGDARSCRCVTKGLLLSAHHRREHREAGAHAVESRGIDLPFRQCW
mmetsp:Transcript_95317/g.308792  ORF Transcript_95317/g.308792 Transcript_95317/m.308792 type:complete len:544 (-) Transcript_95317:1827-3458(-)